MIITHRSSQINTSIKPIRPSTNLHFGSQMSSALERSKNAKTKGLFSKSKKPKPQPPEMPPAGMKLSYQCISTQGKDPR